jgi:hypothetical protein
MVLMLQKKDVADVASFSLRILSILRLLGCQEGKAVVSDMCIDNGPPPGNS